MFPIDPYSSKVQNIFIIHPPIMYINSFRYGQIIFKKPYKPAIQLIFKIKYLELYCGN